MEDYEKERDLEYVKPRLLSDLLSASTQSTDDAIMTDECVKRVSQVSLVCEVETNDEGKEMGGEERRPMVLSDFLESSIVDSANNAACNHLSTDDEIMTDDNLKSAPQVNFVCEAEVKDERREMGGEERRPMMLSNLLTCSMEDSRNNAGCNHLTQIGEHHFTQQTPLDSLIVSSVVNPVNESTDRRQNNNPGIQVDSK